MKAIEAAKLLADRVNQLHYIESIMEKVYKCGLRDATTTPPQQKVSAETILGKHLQELGAMNVSVNACKNDIIRAMEEYRNQPVKFIPERTAKDEAEKAIEDLVDIGLWYHDAQPAAVLQYNNTITALKARGIDTTYEEEVLTILKGM
jgi:hypothetical protein